VVFLTGVVPAVQPRPHSSTYFTTKRDKETTLKDIERRENEKIEREKGT
jgi:hypothetical protein